MSTKNLSELQTLKLRGYSREQLAEFVGECEQAIIEHRAANGEQPPRFYNSMFEEVEFEFAETRDLADAFDRRLTEWYHDTTLSVEEIQTIFEMIDDAPWSGGVPLAQTVQGK